MKNTDITTSAPVILSVSRSTDIPAFYAEWFVNRLREGYAVWYNPFNQRPMRVSFERVKVIVFWTKNPAPLIPYLSELDRRGVHYYFQFTLNDYEREGFESRVPHVSEWFSLRDSRPVNSSPASGGLATASKAVRTSLSSVSWMSLLTAKSSKTS